MHAANNKRYEEKTEKNFKTDWKHKLIRFNKDIRIAVREDADNSEILKIIYQSVDDYSKNHIEKESYERALEGYCYGIPKERARKLYPDIKSIQQDFKVKTNEEIQKHASGWIDDSRINLLLGRTTNSNILSKMKIPFTEEEILSYFIEKILR